MIHFLLTDSHDQENEVATSKKGEKGERKKKSFKSCWQVIDWVFVLDFVTKNTELKSQMKTGQSRHRDLFWMTFMTIWLKSREQFLITWVPLVQVSHLLLNRIGNDIKHLAAPQDLLCPAQMCSLSYLPCFTFLGCLLCRTFKPQVWSLNLSPSAGGLRDLLC